MSISSLDLKSRLRGGAGRALCLVALAAVVVAALAGCGGSGSSSDEEIVASSDPISSSGEATANVPKSYWPSASSATVSGESQGSRSSETRAPDAEEPCALVSKSEAVSILGSDVQAAVGAQGPTCIYSTDSTGDQQVTIVVEQMALATLKGGAKQATRVSVGNTTGWCLNSGDSSVVVPLDEGRVLAVSGPCETARDFAEMALPRVPS